MRGKIGEITKKTLGMRIDEREEMIFATRSEKYAGEQDLFHEQDCAWHLKERCIKE